MRLTSPAEREIARYPWPGNVRELMNVIERAVLLTHGDEIGPGELAIPKLRERAHEPVDPADLGFKIPPEGISLVAVEKAVIEEALNMPTGTWSKRRVCCTSDAGASDAKCAATVSPARNLLELASPEGALRP